MNAINNTEQSNVPSGNKQLIDIVMQLWQSKKTILLFVLVSIFVAIVYFFVAKQKWTSVAIVTLPESGAVANYTNSMSILYALNKSDATTMSSIQNKFFSRFNSKFSALSNELTNQDEPESLVVEATIKDQSLPLSIRYVGYSADNARDTLTKFIEKINQEVINEFNDDLKHNINATMKDLKSSLDTQELIAVERRKQRLDILAQALLIAKESKIETPIVQQAEKLSEDTLFALGSDALSATMKNVGTRPLPLSDHYYKTLQNYMAVKKLAEKSEITSAFQYVMKPSLPIRRDSPKRALTLILAVIVGSILGAGYVLVRDTFRDYQRNESNKVKNITI